MFQVSVNSCLGSLSSVSYCGFSDELAANLEEQKKLGWKGFSTGWALGSESWKTEMAREQARTKLNPGLDAATNKALKEALWESLLLAELKNLGDLSTRSPLVAVESLGKSRWLYIYAQIMESPQHGYRETSVSVPPTQPEAS